MALRIAVLLALMALASAGVNPVRKVVTLMQDMQKEVEAEGAKEKELYDKFMCFCNGGTGDLVKTRDSAAATVEEDTARLSEEQSEKATLELELKSHETDKAAATQDLEKATSLREKERAEFEADSANQKTNLDAITNAIPALERGLGASALVQLDGGAVAAKLKTVVTNSPIVSSSERQDILSFLDGTTSSTSTEQSTGSSDQIVGILKSMKDEMARSLQELQAGEEQSASGFEELRSAKEKEIDVAKESIESKTKRSGALAVSIVGRKDSIDDATEENADAARFLATLGEQCAAKQKDFAERSKARTQEVAAIGEAINILNDDDALDVFKKAVPSALVQDESDRSAHNYGFLAVTPSQHATRLAKAQALLASAIGPRAERAPRLDLIGFSLTTELRSLERTTSKSDSSGPVDFGNVVKMVDDMVDVLNNEAKDDEKKKEWCRDEMLNTGDKMTSAQTKVSGLTAELNEIADEIEDVKSSLTSLKAGIAALDKDVAEATEQRKQEHAEYTEASQLIPAAVQLLGKAKNRLQKFYNPDLYKAPKKAELSEEDRIMANMGFLQIQKHSSVKRSRVSPPEMPEGPASGPVQKNKKSGGVLALIDMIVVDMEKEGHQMQFEEKSAQKEYVALMAESSKTRATDGRAITDKTEMQAELESKQVESKEQRALTSKDMDNINAYEHQLHGSCDYIMENFDSRKEARSTEIEGLKNAKAVLSGANYA